MHLRDRYYILTQIQRGFRSESGLSFKNDECWMCTDSARDTDVYNIIHTPHVTLPHSYSPPVISCVYVKINT
jgi:hypothetical protein